MLYRSPNALALLAALVALAAPPLVTAQELPGLDLSEPEDEQPRPDEEPPPVAPPPPAVEEGPLDLSEAPREPGEEPPRGPAAVLGAPGERDAALGDRVKAVQRKGFLKRGRWELGASFPVSVNDAFFQKVGAGGRLAYHLHDSFALRLRGDWFSSVRTGREREGKVAFSSQIIASQIERQLLLDGVWSPIYGKIAWLGSRIVHFDLFLAAGFGVVWSGTSGEPRDLGPHLASGLGGGLRFYPTDWLALEGGLGATFYPDQPVASVPSTFQRVVAANLALSIFFPFGFEYRHP
jgi:outer membrane beta-barrel protein